MMFMVLYIDQYVTPKVDQFQKVGQKNGSRLGGILRRVQESEDPPYGEQEEVTVDEMLSFSMVSKWFRYYKKTWNCWGFRL